MNANVIRFSMVLRLIPFVRLVVRQLHPIVAIDDDNPYVRSQYDQFHPLMAECRMCKTPKFEYTDYFVESQVNVVYSDIIK